MMAGRCNFCGKPYDDHKLPPIGLYIKPACPPVPAPPKKQHG